MMAMMNNNNNNGFIQCIFVIFIIFVIIIIIIIIKGIGRHDNYSTTSQRLCERYLQQLFLNNNNSF